MKKKVIEQSECIFIIQKEINNTIGIDIFMNWNKFDTTNSQYNEKILTVTTTKII